MGTKVPVAVKKLDKIFEVVEKEFRTEVKTIGQTHHKNLVQLMGFCDEGQHRLLAKLLLLDQSQTFTAIRGMKGYVAPEWFRNMPVIVKDDVYSFEVLSLEIICGRKCVDIEVSTERAILTDWAYDCYEDGIISALVENDKEIMNGMKKLKRFVKVAIWCILKDLALRPTIKMAILMLEDFVQVAAPPCPRPFTTVVG
ncbi:hypothetical protein GH714_011780 [Hevea brasiliensis]|uniref:Serine-threonine/tyrosine-protein kinase catalytic domain-containing protein n=1 Tax=Hevea brasiliensis TaxID=3981 RepID=A0A6A6KQJ2_HEVBR|nr:hypothetical protein GH714_011780 [Hevea brasiliensis]